MRVGLIDLDHLLRVRRSFRLRWRLPVAVLFLFFSCGWWMTVVAGYKSGDPLFLPSERLRVQTFVFYSIISLLTLVALFRKDDFARLYFAIASSFVALNATLIATLPGPNGLIGHLAAAEVESTTIITIFLITIAVTWKVFIRYSYVLYLSAIPLGRGKSIRQQVLHSLNANSASLSNIEFDRKARKDKKIQWKSALIRYFLPALTAIAIGLLSAIIASMVSVNNDLALAIHKIDLAKSISIISNFGLASLDNADVTFEKFLWTNVFLLLAYFNMIIVGFLWHRWRRSRLLIDRIESPGRIPPLSLLLLRHSRDDVMRVPNRRFRPSRFLFMAFEWNYTLEELMAERLAFVGPLCALGAYRDTTRVFNVLLKRLRAWSGKSSRTEIRRLGIYVNWLRKRMPYRLSPQGASRFYLDNRVWENFVQESIPAAKAIVLVMGSAKGDKLNSQFLEREMEWIKTNGCLDKTIFVMPSMLFPWQMKSRWRKFSEYITPVQRGKKLPKAKRVLCVCHCMGEPVIITASERNEFAYESAFDVAGSIAGTTSAHRNEMIMKHKAIFHTS